MARTLRLLVLAAALLVTLPGTALAVTVTPNYQTQLLSGSNTCTSAYTVGGYTAKAGTDFTANWSWTYGSSGSAWASKLVTGVSDYSAPDDINIARAGDRCDSNDPAYAERIRVISSYTVVYTTSRCSLQPGISFGFSKPAFSVTPQCSGGEGMNQYRFPTICEPADGKVNHCRQDLGKMIWSAPDGVRLLGIVRQVTAGLRSSKRGAEYLFSSSNCTGAVEEMTLQCGR